MGDYQITNTGSKNVWIREIKATLVPGATIEGAWLSGLAEVPESKDTKISAVSKPQSGGKPESKPGADDGYGFTYHTLEHRIGTEKGGTFGDEHSDLKALPTDYKKRIDELEKRIDELEHTSHTHYVPNPIQVNPPWNPYWPPQVWC